VASEIENARGGLLEVIASGDDARLAAFIADELQPLIDRLREDLRAAEDLLEIAAAVGRGRRGRTPDARPHRTAQTVEGRRGSSRPRQALDLSGRDGLAALGVRKLILLILLERAGEPVDAKVIRARMAELGAGELAKQVSYELTRLKNPRSAKNPPLVVHEDKRWALNAQGIEVAEAIAADL
jgi:hypothetical protein